MEFQIAYKQNKKNMSTNIWIYCSDTGVNHLDKFPIRLVNYYTHKVVTYKKIFKLDWFGGMLDTTGKNTKLKRQTISIYDLKRLLNNCYVIRDSYIKLLKDIIGKYEKSREDRNLSM